MLIDKAEFDAWKLSLRKLKIPVTTRTNKKTLRTHFFTP